MKSSGDDDDEEEEEEEDEDEDDDEDDDRIYPRNTHGSSIYSASMPGAHPRDVLWGGGGKPFSKNVVFSSRRGRARVTHVS